jgi:hypothetical protein
MRTSSSHWARRRASCTGSGTGTEGVVVSGGFVTSTTGAPRSSVLHAAGPGGASRDSGQYKHSEGRRHDDWREIGSRATPAESQGRKPQQKRADGRGSSAAIGSSSVPAGNPLQPFLWRRYARRQARYLRTRRPAGVAGATISMRLPRGAQVAPEPAWGGQATRARTCATEAANQPLGNGSGAWGARSAPLPMEAPALGERRPKGWTTGASPPPLHTGRASASPRWPRRSVARACLSAPGRFAALQCG